MRAASWKALGFALWASGMVSAPARTTAAPSSRSIPPDEFLTLPVEVQGFYVRIPGSGWDADIYRYEVDVRTPVPWGLSWQDGDWLLGVQTGWDGRLSLRIAANPVQHPLFLDQPIRVTLAIVSETLYSPRSRAQAAFPRIPASDY